MKAEEKAALSELRFVVIGAGIAGLSAAVSLIQRGARKITIFDGEALPFSQASGRNAAIFRPLEADRAIAELAAESRKMLLELGQEAGAPLLEESGLLMLDRKGQELQKMQLNAESLGLTADYYEELPDEAKNGSPITSSGPALYCAEGGILDPHEIGQVLTRSLHRSGVELRLQTEVESLLITGGSSSAPLNCRGIVLADGEEILADAVILAAGAASARLAHNAGSSLPLLPLQRHLGVIESDTEYPPKAPVVWQLDPEIYFRPESGGVLVSPCDESPSRSGTPQADLEVFEPIAERLQETCPSISAGRLRRYWACIRTKAVDGRPVIGADPTISSLHWLTGLGGFGMTCGLAAGKRFADILADGGEDIRFSPRRFHIPY